MAMTRIVGHKSPNISLRIYVHVNMESKREVMDARRIAFVTS